MPSKEEISDATPLGVPMPDVVSFVRQLSHDLRNNLNALELQSAYLHEIAEDGEVKEEVKRLRGTLTQMARNLQQISVALGPIRLSVMPYEAALLMEDLRRKTATQFPEISSAVEWEMELEGAMLQIDPQLMQDALLELFTNALYHERGEGSLRVTARVEKGQFVFNLTEPKTSSPPLENWGRSPFQKMSQGHYGLGLWRARGIIEAHGGRLEVRYDPGFLVTTIFLPLDSSK